MSQIRHLASQMYPGRMEYMLEAYKDAIARPFGYLVVDLKQDTHDYTRLRTNIFPGEEHIVYIEKCRGLNEMRHF